MKRKPRRDEAAAAVCLAALFGLAFAVRSFGYEWVFTGNEVVFAPADAQYHVRRAFYTFANFPAALFWDAYINFPEGAAVAWPPLFDWCVGAVGWLMAEDAASFDRVAAWAPPVIGALTLVPTYAVGRHLESRATGLLAAGLLALLPVSATFAHVGNPDHHCAVALLGACLLLVLVRLVDRDPDAAAWPQGLTVALAALRVGLLLTWHGSLLYLGFVDAVLWVAAAFSGRRDLYAAQAVSALATSAIIAPFVWSTPLPLGGAWSAIALSWLHVAAVSGVAGVSGLLCWLERDGTPKRSPGALLGYTLAAGLAVLVALLLLPGARVGLEPALRFLTLRDDVGAQTVEQSPLFSLFGLLGRTPWRSAIDSWGLFAYAIPLAPLAARFAIGRERRSGAWVLAAWTAFFGALAIVQRRYGNDLAPGAVVAFAVGLAWAARRAVAWVGVRRSLAPVVATAVGLLLLLPPILTIYAPRATSSLRALRGELAVRDRALLTAPGSLTRFLTQVRRLTPPTSGFLDPHESPEYGIVAHANLGHAIQNVAHRPTPTDPFWHFIGHENWDAAFGLLDAPSEQRGYELAAKLRARYVVTQSFMRSSVLAGWLHRTDGRSLGDWTHAEHFRLVAEGPRGGLPLAAAFRRGVRRKQTRMPYKLFEVVAGSVLEVPSEAGSRVVAALELETGTGRSFVYEASAVADPSGVARLRVAHATTQDPHSLVRARGPYRLDTSWGSSTLDVAPAQLREGVTIRVPQGS